MISPRLRTVPAIALLLILGSAAWLLVPPARRPAYPPPAHAVAGSEAQAIVARAATAERVEVADLAVPPPLRLAFAQVDAALDAMLDPARLAA